jgi:DNA-directed RNA polymerase specialized sigma24 family protein
MEEPHQSVAAAASSADPTVGLRAVVALYRLAETLEALQVRNAREKGWSWQEIADALGVSEPTIRRHWAVARVRLFELIAERPDPPETP